MAEYEPPKDQTTEFPSVVGPQATYTPPSGPPTPPEGVPPVRPRQKKKKNKAKPFVIAGICVLVALLAGGGASYWFYFRKKAVPVRAVAAPPCSLNGTWLATPQGWVESINVTNGSGTGTIWELYNGNIAKATTTLTVTQRGNHVTGSQHNTGLGNVAQVNATLAQNCQTLNMTWTQASGGNTVTQSFVFHRTDADGVSLAQQSLDNEAGTSTTPTTSPSYSPPSTSGGSGSGGGIVAMGANIDPNPTSGQADQTISVFYAAVNNADYSSAWNYFTSSDQSSLGSESTWAKGMMGSVYSHATMVNLTGNSASGPLVAEVTFDTDQNGDCKSWDLNYTLQPSSSSSTGYLIDSAKPVSGNGYSNIAC